MIVPKSFGDCLLIEYAPLHCKCSPYAHCCVLLCETPYAFCCGVDTLCICGEPPVDILTRMCQSQQRFLQCLPRWIDTKTGVAVSLVAVRGTVSCAQCKSSSYMFVATVVSITPAVSTGAKIEGLFKSEHYWYRAVRFRRKCPLATESRFSSCRKSSVSKWRHCTFLYSMPWSPSLLGTCRLYAGLKNDVHLLSKHLDEGVAKLHSLAFGTGLNDPNHIHADCTGVEVVGPFQGWAPPLSSGKVLLQTRWSGHGLPWGGLPWGRGSSDDRDLE